MAAKGRIEQEIALKVTGVEDVQKAEKLIDSLDSGKKKIEIKVDTGDADRDVGKLIERVKQLDAKDAIVTLAVEAGQAQNELNDLLVELAKFDGSDAEAQVKIDQINQARSDLEDLTAEIERIDSTTATVDIDTSSAKQGIDDIGKSADSSKSVLANMVGNATQDLGALGGVAGSAGVAIGQMGEYMADAANSGEGFSSIIKNFSGIAGPIAALSVGVGLLSKAWSDMQAEQKRVAENSKNIADDISSSFEQIESAADIGIGGVLSLTDLLAASFLKTQETSGRTLQSIVELGIGVKNLGTTLAALDQGTAGRTSFFENLLNGSDKFHGATATISRDVARLIVEGENFNEIYQSALNISPETAAFVTNNRRMIEAVEQLDDAGEDFSLKQVIADTKDELLKTVPGIEAWAAATAELGDGATDYEILNRAIEIYNSNQLKATAATKAHQTEVEALAARHYAAKAATDAARQAEEELNDTMREAGFAWDAAAQMGESYAAALDEINAASDVDFAQQAFKTVESFDATKEALKDLAKTGKDWKNVDLVPDSVEELRGVPDEVKAVTDAIAGQRDAIQTELGNVLSTEGIDAYSEKFDFFAQQVSEQYMQMFRDMGLSEEEAKWKTIELMDELNLLPEDKEIQIKLTHEAQARAALETFRGVIEQLPEAKQIAINTAIAEGDIDTALTLLNDELINRGYDPIELGTDVDTSAAQGDVDRFIIDNNGRVIKLQASVAIRPIPLPGQDTGGLQRSVTPEADELSITPMAEATLTSSSASWSSPSVPVAVLAGQPIINNTYVTIPTADPSAMVQALQRWTRTNGQLPISRGRG